MKPDLKEARIRTTNQVNTIRDAYKISEEDKLIGVNKKYYIKK